MIELSKCCSRPQTDEFDPLHPRRFKCSKCGTFTKPQGHSDYRGTIVHQLDRFMKKPWALREKAMEYIEDIFSRWEEKVRASEDESFKSFWLPKIEGLRNGTAQMYRANLQKRFYDVRTSDWHKTLTRHLKEMNGISL